MNNGNKYNVALYLRLSRDDNDGNKESMSISNQRELLKEYVHERGWSIEDIYIDDGYSGTTFDRPDFKRMIQDIELVTLIDRIEVHLPERVNNKKQYRISIYYKFMESVESKELDAA